MITLNCAKKVNGAAKKKAAELGQPMNVAIVDSGGKFDRTRTHGQRLYKYHRHLN